MTYKTPKTTKSSRSKSSSGSKRINRKSAEWLEMSSEQKQKILDERKKAANLRRQKSVGKVTLMTLLTNTF